MLFFRGFTIILLVGLFSRVRSNDIDEICKVNLNAAKLLGRADLVRTWSLVSIMMEKSLYPNESNDERPWAAHPFGRRLVESLYVYFNFASIFPLFKEEIKGDHLLKSLFLEVTRIPCRLSLLSSNVTRMPLSLL